jgi:hypothetical protein
MRAACIAARKPSNEPMLGSAAGTGTPFATR